MDLRESAKVQDNQQRHPWELARAEVLLHQLKQLKANKFSSILDLGCGDTFLVEFLAKAFPKVQFYAVDIAFSDELLERLKKQVPQNVHVFKHLDDLPIQIETIDAVLLLDVIEHIEDEIGFLNDVNEKPFITTDTNYLITVPAYQSLFCTHDLFLGHYRRYTNSTLKSRVAKGGLNVLKCSYFFSVLIPPRLLQVIKEKLLKPTQATTGLVEWNGSSTKTNLIKSILWLDYKVHFMLGKLGIVLPGLSNLALCRPRA